MILLLTCRGAQGGSGGRGEGEDTLEVEYRGGGGGESRMRSRTLACAAEGRPRERVQGHQGLRPRGRGRDGLALSSQQRRGGKGACGGSWCTHGKVSRRPPLPPLRSHLTLSFTNFCPFTVMRLRDLPNPQIYTRQERYRAQPPCVLEPGGFHSNNSLAVYQGLVYYLLWLHSKYDKVGAWRRPGPSGPGLV